MYHRSVSIHFTYCIYSEFAYYIHVMFACILHGILDNPLLYIFVFLILKNKQLFQTENKTIQSTAFLTF